MSETLDLIIKGATIVNHAGTFQASVGVRDGKTVAIGSLDDSKAGEVIDATGLHLLPGVIDTQVHFREPGNTHKEDLESGSRAAVLGGVTAVFEMPNTNPLTTTEAAINDKIARGTDRMWCDFAFYVGATPDNARELKELERLPGVSGVKIFMGASTGDLLVSKDEDVEEVLRHGSRRVAVHCEDQDRMDEREHLREEGNVHTHPVWRDEESALRATTRLVNLAHKTGRRIHVLHVTTAEEMAYLAHHKDIATVEATPQHITLYAPDIYDRMGTFAQMNPPIRDVRHQPGLWQAITNGVVDVIGSDHAPHTREEKEATYPASPSGFPGVQTLLPVLLNHVAEGRMTLERLVDLTSHGANRIFNLEGKGRLAVGYDADYTLVDLKSRWTIEDSWIASKCGWTPYRDMQVTGKPVGTIIRGRRVMWEGSLANMAKGTAMRFQETICPK